MAERAFMYCPLCRDNSNGHTHNELVRETIVFKCPAGHEIPQDRLESLRPEMMKLQVFYKPRPTDLKFEFFCDPKVMEKARAQFGDSWHREIETLLTVVTSGPFVVIDGAQAKKLQSMKVKNGYEMVACAESNQTLENENNDLKKQLAFFESIFKRTAETLQEPA